MFRSRPGVVAALVAGALVWAAPTPAQHDPAKPIQAGNLIPGGRNPTPPQPVLTVDSYPRR